MLQRKSKNSSGKARDDHAEQNLNFCEAVRDFVNDSRKSQTIYANVEAYHERTVKNDDLTLLHDLVFLTLSDGKDRSSLTSDEFAETEKLTKLMEKKICDSHIKHRSWSSEIRFQVVWIYYFDYLEKEMRAMPVFKVYKSNSGSHALYIDVTVVEYDSWDHFIMYSQFPASFICVPRKGEYTFRSFDGEDLLDLEYICKNSQLRDKFPRTIRPFSQILVQKMLNTAPYVHNFLRFIISNMNVIVKTAEIFGWEVFPPYVGLITIIINVFAILLRVIELIYGGKEFKDLESVTEDCGLMLVNERGKKPSHWKNFLNLMYDIVERLLRDRSWIDLMNYLKNPRENLKEILKFVPVVLEVCKPYICEVSRVEAAVVYVFLLFISTVLGEDTEKKKSLEKGSENWLCNLEKYSSEKVFSELEPPNPLFENVVSQKFVKNVWLDLFDFRVHLLLEHTRPDCKRFLQNLLKSNFTLEEGISCQNITLDGSSIGVLIPFTFLSKDHAIVALVLDKLPEVSNKNRNFGVTL